MLKSDYAVLWARPSRVFEISGQACSSLCRRQKNLTHPQTRPAPQIKQTVMPTLSARGTGEHFDRLPRKPPQGKSHSLPDGGKKEGEISSQDTDDGCDRTWRSPPRRRRTGQTGSFDGSGKEPAWTVSHQGRLRPRTQGHPDRRAVSPRHQTCQTGGAVSWWWRLPLLLTMVMSPVCSQSCSALTGCFTPSGVELIGGGFPGRTVQVSSTCGELSSNGAEIYRSLVANDVTNYMCLTSQHGKDRITDVTADGSGLPDLTTYWQSANTVPAVGASPLAQTVVINFTDAFLVTQVLIYFIAPNASQSDQVIDARPKAMRIEKWNATTQSWVMLRTFAESCAAFPNLTVLRPPAVGNPLVAYCREAFYAGHQDTTYTDSPHIQFVELNLGVQYRTDLQNNLQVNEHFTTSALRITLLKPANQEPAKSYYAIAHVIVEGRCECYGHASSCTGQNGADCECEHDTMGKHCQQCLPLYNDRPWQMGTVTRANECQACFCNNHATSCHYDSNLGYGICDDCSNHTTGPNCTQCDSGFFVNPAYNANAGHDELCEGFPCRTYCIECGCNADGTQLGLADDCAADRGQCTCKTNVVGVKCDECKDTYWGLTGANALGCSPCDCDPAGSYNTSNFCDKVTGVCVCKNNTDSQRCDRCKPETFGFSAAKEDGCTACDCDPGGSLDNACDVIGNTNVLGQCRCRSNIEGRDCREPAPGYFVPKIDYFLVEAEEGRDQSPNLVERPGHGLPGATCSGRGFVTLSPGGSITVTKVMPLSGLFDLLVRYEKTGVSQGVQVEVSMLNAASYTCRGETYPASFVWRLSSDISQTALRGAAMLGALCVQSGTQYSVTMTTSGTAALLVDSVFFMPKIQELSVYTNATQAEQLGIRECQQDVMVKFAPDRPSCDAVEYFIMAEVIGGAVGCACNSQFGNGACDPYTGDCPCPTGVLPPDCDACRVGYYDENNILLDGCTACECHSGGAVSPICNDTGVCQCRQNVIGTKCDVCLPEHYGLASGSGCTHCRCNMDYAINNSCTDSGACHCKPGVGGLLCDTCLDGFFNLTTEGCSPCNCDPDGSTSSSCAQDGICTCKPRVTGRQCDECKSGFFGLGPWHPDGCIACYCTEHTTNCTTATGWHNASITSSWSLFDSSAVDARWDGHDDQGGNITVDDVVIFERSILAQYVMRLINSEDNYQRRMLYFSAPSLYLGDKRSAYGRELTVLLHVSTNDSLITNYTGGDIILKGAYSDVQLMYALPYLPTNSTVTMYTVVFLETDWHVGSTDGPTATYSQMMLILSMLQELLIRGKFSNADGAVVDLHGVELNHATSTAAGSDAQPVNNVEHCFCPETFGGDFCETCGVGYWRNSTVFGPLDSCTACICNHHENGPCNVLTGVCSCTHNATGNNCQLCLPGFYGNAVTGTPGDCKPCMCPGSVPDQVTNAFAATCELDVNSELQCINCSNGHGGKRCEFCMQDFYGTPTNASNALGVCMPCKCNGRASTCDTVTGVCINCANNTGGKECEICASGYYGNAMTGSCKECQCKSAGATGECDPVTGQCKCHLNVMGFFCDLCIPYSYNYTSGSGCTLCSCHPQGAQGSGCDLTTGQCVCRQHVTGRHCDICQDTYWQLNSLTGCDQCSCNSSGTLQVEGETFGTCDLHTGQCQCALEGIIGRTCDRCSTISKLTFEYISLFNIGEYPQCVMCGECFDQWGLVVDSTGKQLDELHNRTSNVWAHYGNLGFETVNTILSDIESRISEAGSSVSRVQNITMALTQLGQQLQQIQDKTAQAVADTQQLQLDYDTVRQNISVLGSFTGVVTIGNSTVTTSSLLLVELVAAATQADAAVQRSNTSWQQIQQLQSQLASVNSLATQFSRRGDSAMQLLEVARRTFETADSIHNNTFVTAYSSNAAELNETEYLLQAISTQLTELEGILTTVQADFTAANTSLHGMVQASEIQMGQWMNTRLLLQGIVGDVSTATDKVNAAQASVSEFQVRTMEAVRKMMGAFEDVLEGLIILKQIQGNIATATTTIITISGISLRPLAEMRQLALSIGSTVVSTENVAETNTKAAAALAMAQDVKAEMEQTLADSQQVLEEVTTIQGNIRDATDILSATRKTHNETAILNTTIHTAVDEAQATAAQLNSLVTTTTGAINRLQGQITEVSDCLQTRRVEASGVTSEADVAFQQSQSAVQVQKTLSEIMTEVASQTLSNVDTSLSTIQTASALLAALQADLAAVESPVRITDVFQTYLQQRSELESLKNEVDTLQIQLDNILAGLTMESSTATCQG